LSFEHFGQVITLASGRTPSRATQEYLRLPQRVKHRYLLARGGPGSW
jgi:hypothetical protein